jgi:hypothetical protein
MYDPHSEKSHISGQRTVKNDRSQFLKFLPPLFGFTKKEINLEIRATLCLFWHIFLMG